MAEGFLDTKETRTQTREPIYGYVSGIFFSPQKLKPNLFVSLSPHHQVLLESVKLAVALLEGGHRAVQGSFWKYLSRPSSEDFFKEIHNKFQEAELEIKNSPVGLVITQEVSVVS